MNRQTQWARGRVQRGLVGGLATLCDVPDAILYRMQHPLVRRLAKSWDCWLARRSVALDERWATGFWDAGGAPGERCAICEYRPSIHELAVRGEGGEPLLVCGWCETKLDWSDFDAALVEARRLSVPARR